MTSKTVSNYVMGREKPNLSAQLRNGVAKAEAFGISTRGARRAERFALL